MHESIPTVSDVPRQPPGPQPVSQGAEELSLGIPDPHARTVKSPVRVVDAFQRNNAALRRPGVEAVFDGMRVKPIKVSRCHSAPTKKENRKSDDESFRELATPGGFRRQYVKTRRRKVTTVNLASLAAQLQVSVESLRAGMTSGISQAPPALGESPLASFIALDRSNVPQRMTTTTMRRRDGISPDYNAPANEIESSPLLGGGGTYWGGTRLPHRRVKIVADVEERFETVTHGGSGGDQILVPATAGDGLAIFVQDDDNQNFTTVAMTEDLKRIGRGDRRKKQRVTIAPGEVESVVLIDSLKGHPNDMMMQVQLALPRVAWCFLVVSAICFSFIPLMAKQMSLHATNDGVLSYASWQSQGVFALVCVVSSAMIPFFSDGTPDFLLSLQGTYHVVGSLLCITISLYAMHFSLQRTQGSTLQTSVGWILQSPIILLWRYITQDEDVGGGRILRNEILGAFLTLVGTGLILLSDPTSQSFDAWGFGGALVSGGVMSMFILTLKSMRYRLPVHHMMAAVFGGVAFLHVMTVLVYYSADVMGALTTTVFGWRGEGVLPWWAGLVALTFTGYFTLSVCVTFFDPFTMAIALSGQLLLIRVGPTIVFLRDDPLFLGSLESPMQWTALVIGGILNVLGAVLGAHYSARERSLVHVHLRDRRSSKSNAVLSATVGAMLAQQNGSIYGRHNDAPAGAFNTSIN